MPICRKCGDSFPNRVVLEGKTHGLGRRRFCLKCSPFGAHNTRKLDQMRVRAQTQQSIVCVMCEKEYQYRRGYSRERCPSCNSNHRRFVLKNKAIAYKGGKCVLCGYSRCVRALCFHHKGFHKKDFTISGNHCRKWEVVKQELDKCVLLCTNCHAEVHSGLMVLLETKCATL